MKEFPHEGIFYFSTDADDNDDNDKRRKDPVEPLAVIVVPATRFHYRSINKGDFDSAPIVTNINDFVLWQFEHSISRNVVQLNNNERLSGVIASHERAAAGKNRRCLAVECVIAGTFFFTNPGRMKSLSSIILLLSFRIRTSGWFRTGLSSQRVYLN